MENKLVLQKIIVDNVVKADGTKDLYYRSDHAIIRLMGTQEAYVLEHGYYDFSTFLNSFSLEKWITYTSAESITLEMDTKGEFILEIMGHYVDEYGEIHKEWLGNYHISSISKQHYSFSIPLEVKSIVVAFQITAIKDVYFYDGYYAAETSEKLNEPKIGVLVCDRKKGSPKRAFSFLNRAIEKEEDLSPFFNWKKTNIDCQNTEQMANEIHAEGYTHIIVMHEEAIYLSDSFRSICQLLRMLRPEYEMAVIIGEEMDISNPNNQLDTKLVDPQKKKNLPGFDMSKWDSVILNETDQENNRGDSQFQCMPVSIVDKKAESTIQISMNNICFWHEKRHLQENNKYLLQKLILDSNAMWDGTQDMYYRSEEKIMKSNDRQMGFILPRAYYDFFTYFNSISYGKWMKYTNIKSVSLELEMQGDFVIHMMGHYQDSARNIHKEWLGHYPFNTEGRRKNISITIPKEINSQVVSFQISANSECKIFDGYYAAKIDEKDIRDPFITLATTTFKKEEYIRNNIELLKKHVFADPELSKHFNWKIVDNGSTLDPDKYNNEWLEIIPNRNVGGSGGFCRGMLAANEQSKQPTHVLLMDDDVCFFPESFRRLYMLLNFLRPEFDNYFISGAMLEINQRNIQHEDVGMFRLNGEHGPVKPRYDLNRWDSVICNEAYLKDDVHEYAGWWFCCIPMSIARKDNLPLPFFIRGDDVEYSIRNHARFITMNGICIWHEGFGTKFSASLELYQVHRNDLILQSMNDHLKDVKVIDRMKQLFWEEIFKFNYKACDLILDAVEDFLKGPDFIKKLDGEKCMKEKKAKDNQLQPITEEVRKRIDIENLYNGGSLNGNSLYWYGHFVNGQKLPEFLAGKRTVVIPYGWGYSQEKLYQAKDVYAVDPQNDLYVKYTRNRKRFKELNNRYNTLMDRFEKEYATVSDSYRKSEKEMESSVFWKDYLGK